MPLEFVDVEVEADCGRRREEKNQKPFRVLLAKKVSYNARAVGNSIFDWDDK